MENLNKEVFTPNTPEEIRDEINLKLQHWDGLYETVSGWVSFKDNLPLDTDGVIKIMSENEIAHENVIKYFDLVFPMVPIGGVIITDNMLYPEKYRQDMKKFSDHNHLYNNRIRILMNFFSKSRVRFGSFLTLSNRRPQFYLNRWSNRKDKIQGYRKRR